MSLRDTLNNFHYKKKEIELDIFNSIYQKCLNTITSDNAHNKTTTIFDIPNFILGKPPYDIKKCIVFIVKKLKNEGINCKIYKHEPTKLIISWDKLINNTIREKMDKQHPSLFYDKQDINIFKTIFNNE